MITKAVTYFLLPMLILFSRCDQKPDLEVEKKKLLAVHKEQQNAHLNKNAQQFVDQFADKSKHIFFIF